MKKLPTLPPVLEDSFESDRSAGFQILPVETDLEIADMCCSGAYGVELQRGTPFIIKDGKRRHVEPLPLSADR